jgi:hypothetical protein
MHRCTLQDNLLTSNIITKKNKTITFTGQAVYRLAHGTGIEKATLLKHISLPLKLHLPGCVKA